MASTAQQLQQALSNGYTGPTVQKGKDLYTPYGALLRNDGFIYPEGAKISPNGMYVDTGNGWQFAKHAVGSDGNYHPSSVTGLAPGSSVLGPGESWSSAQKPPPSGGTKLPPDTTTPVEEPKAETPAVDPELERYWKKLFGVL